MRSGLKTKDLTDSESDRNSTRLYGQEGEIRGSCQRAISQEETFLSVIDSSTVVKDEPERRSRSHLARSTFREHLHNDTEQRCGCQDGRPQSVVHEPLQDATMRPGSPTEAIAGRNDEVGRNRRSAKQLDDLDGGYDDE